VHRRSIAPLVLALTFAVSACAQAGPATTGGPGSTPAGSATPPASVERSPASPEAQASPSASQQATPSKRARSEPPTEAPTDSPEAEATPASSIADACTGTADNRMFFVGAAQAIDWPVLCAVLGNRWNVSTGTYRLGNGGRLEIGYKGPGGATLSLAEGSFCQGADGCVPAGTDVKPTKLGPLDGTLVALDDGGYAIVVDRGKNPSWLLEAHGIDQAATVRLGKAVAEVAD
jgi:hypothetical protein